MEKNQNPLVCKVKILCKVLCTDIFKHCFCGANRAFILVPHKNVISIQLLLLLISYFFLLKFRTGIKILFLMSIKIFQLVLLQIDDIEIRNDDKIWGEIRNEQNLLATRIALKHIFWCTSTICFMTHRTRISLVSLLVTRITHSKMMMPTRG